MSFESFGLPVPLLRAIADAGYTEATPIQAQAIPAALEGRDLLASANTGTGKTAAFMIPALARIAQPSQVAGRGPRILVLTPTRELATQVAAAATTYGRQMRAKVVSILGGMPYAVQNRMLSQPVDVLVATPGRLLDHIQSGKINFSRLEVLILDEADRMLDMGFIDDVEAIAAATPATRQTLLFSATLEKRVAELAGSLLKDPLRIDTSERVAPQSQIEQNLYYTDDLNHKCQLLEHLLRDASLKQAVVFTATKRDADDLADRLKGQGHSAAPLHGDMSQQARNRVITRLRRNDIRVLVATDVAARGIDVNTVTHVFNFDLPHSAEDYVHRIGRTGRAGASGVAASLVSFKDRGLVKRIERYTGVTIPVQTVVGLEPKARPPRSDRPRRDGRPPQWTERNREWQSRGTGARHQDGGRRETGAGRTDARTPAGGDSRFAGNRPPARNDGAARRQEGVNRKPAGFGRQSEPRKANRRDGF